MSFETLLSMSFYLLAHHGSAWPGPSEGPGFVLAFLAAATTALSYVAVFPLLVARTRDGSQKKEDCEAVLHHFLPF